MTNIKECEFYNDGLCSCGDIRVPKEIGYADILCSDECNSNCKHRQLLASKQENEKMREALEEIKKTAQPLQESSGQMRVIFAIATQALSQKEER